MDMVETRPLPLNPSDIINKPDVFLPLELVMFPHKHTPVNVLEFERIGVTLGQYYPALNAAQFASADTFLFAFNYNAITFQHTSTVTHLI